MSSAYSTRTKSGSEKNAAVLKKLLSLPENKYCADCKRHDHPRWASWSLGVFICIRCSGIHRSMGVHVSRVKSVDLDTWTDEQLQNMINWGNRRANRYWEANLVSGHAPIESKIENFIRTKYELKKWILSPSIPSNLEILDIPEDSEPVSKYSTTTTSRNAPAVRSVTNAESQKKQQSTNDIFSSFTEAAPVVSSTGIPIKNIPISNTITQTSEIRNATPIKSQNFAKNPLDLLLDTETNKSKLDLSEESQRQALKYSILSLYQQNKNTTSDPKQKTNLASTIPSQTNTNNEKSTHYKSNIELLQSIQFDVAPKYDARSTNNIFSGLPTSTTPQSLTSQRNSKESKFTSNRGLDIAAETYRQISDLSISEKKPNDSSASQHTLSDDQTTQDEDEHAFHAFVSAKTPSYATNSNNTINTTKTHTTNSNFDPIISMPMATNMPKSELPENDHTEKKHYRNLSEKSSIGLSDTDDLFLDANVWK